MITILQPHSAQSDVYVSRDTSRFTVPGRNLHRPSQAGRLAFFALGLIAAALLLTGCFTTSTKFSASKGLPILEATADQAIVHVYRTSVRAGFMPLEVFLDGKLVGVTKGSSFCSFPASPGSHALRVIQGGNGKDLTLNLRAGAATYIEQGFDFLGIVTLKEANEAKGARTIRKLRQVRIEEQ